MAAFTLAVALTSDAAALVAALAAVIACFRLARLPASALSSALRPALPFLLLLIVLQAAVTGPGASAILLVRNIAIILAASLVTYTTKTADMIDGLANAMRPFERFGLSPAKTALALVLAIRFIPAMIQGYRDIEAARLARGGRRYSVLVLGPLILMAIRMATDIGDAVISRGFEDRGEP